MFLFLRNSQSKNSSKFYDILHVLKTLCDLVPTMWYMTKIFTDRHLLTAHHYHYSYQPTQLSNIKHCIILFWFGLFTWVITCLGACSGILETTEATKSNRFLFFVYLSKTAKQNSFHFLFKLFVFNVCVVFFFLRFSASYMNIYAGCGVGYRKM